MSTFSQILKPLANPNLRFGIAIVCGIVAGCYSTPVTNGLAESIADVFMNLLRLVSLPIIFLSIVSTASSMESLEEIKSLGSKVVKYTLLTTVIAATLALILFIVIDPVKTPMVLDGTEKVVTNQKGYLTYLMKVIPSNLVRPFLENNVMGVLFMAMLLSLATIALPNENRKILHAFFSSLYAAVMKITTWIIHLMPIAIFAFITLFILDLKKGLEIKSLAFYLSCVVLANLIQAIVILPTLLKAKGVPPLQLFRAMMPALSVAFFTKSSGAALPMAIRCAEERAGVSKKVASFSLPLCTTINMNACAAFILITVLFVSMSNGLTFSLPEMIGWIFIATLAAVGNAGLPMGCYFLASAFLAAMNVPLNILGVILPFYSLIDMLESAINVWSDSCVTAVVSKEMEAKDEVYGLGSSEIITHHS